MDTQPIDREKTCPLLLRTFWSVDRSHSPLDYKNAAVGILPANEVQIYTWRDATLREITDLVKDVVLPAPSKQRNSSFNMSLVYPDRNGEHRMRKVARIHLHNPGPDDERTLADLQFETGDFVDLTVSSAGEREVKRDFRGRGGGRGRGRY